MKAGEGGNPPHTHHRLPKHLKNATFVTYIRSEKIFSRLPREYQTFSTSAPEHPSTFEAFLTENYFCARLVVVDVDLAAADFAIHEILLARCCRFLKKYGE